MQRGKFGIEFDDGDGFPFRKMVWLAALIPAAVVLILIFRGCSREPAPVDIGSADPVEQPSAYPAQPAKRGERAPFFGFGNERKPQEAGRPATGVAAPSEPPPSVAKPPESLPTPTDDTSKKIPDTVQKKLSEITAAEQQNDLLAARSMLLALHKSPEGRNIQEFLERKLAKINQTLLFGDRPMPGKIVHKIQAGDLIGKISRQYNTTQEFVLKANRIDNPGALRIGKELWVLNKPNFCLTVYKKACTAVLTLNGEFFRRYPVGIGPSQDVPTGTYALSSRKKHPSYSRPGQRTIPYNAQGNILGTVWLGLSPTRDTPVVKGFGLHGTWVNASLGQNCKEGRIRFSNSDIEQLELLLPLGTRVNVVE